MMMEYFSTLDGAMLSIDEASSRFLLRQREDAAAAFRKLEEETHFTVDVTVLIRVTNVVTGPKRPLPNGKLLKLKKLPAFPPKRRSSRNCREYGFAFTAP